MQTKTHEIWDKNFLSQIIDAMADGVFTLDTRGRITSWNRSMIRITGYPAAEALGKTCNILQCSRCFDQECPEGPSICGILDHGQSEDFECLVRHKTGLDVPVIKNARVVRNNDGDIIGIVETLTDLTELKKARLKAEQAQRLLEEKHRLGNIIGHSRSMQQVFNAIQVAAASHATVLIQGESGTGKELVARAIHYNSARRDKPLVIVNCSALTESLLESELFGHVRGAFTGALRDRTGRFEEADGGTVFLDEIGEITPFIQIKLLRVLQEREIERVGDSRRRRVDIRIIAATNQDLFSRVQQGKFRQDVYYRLKVFPINLPPLRKRKDDIPLLLTHFIEQLNRKTGKQITGLQHEAMQLVLDYAWPGNIRELENAVEHAFVLRNKGKIGVFDLPLEIRQMRYAPKNSTAVSASRSRIQLDRRKLLDILDACGWNKAEAARRVGLSRTAVWKYMKKWDIPLQPPRQE